MASSCLLPYRVNHEHSLVVSPRNFRESCYLLRRQPNKFWLPKSTPRTITIRHYSWELSVDDVPNDDEGGRQVRACNRGSRSRWLILMSNFSANPGYLSRLSFVTYFLFFPARTQWHCTGGRPDPASNTTEIGQWVKNEGNARSCPIRC